MATRNEWSFEYTASVLAAAATKKKEHHEGRLKWWSDKQAEVIADVREKGLEVSESLAMEYASASAFSGMGRGAQLVVKNDYQTKLNECFQKIKAHSELVKGFDGWRQMLNANPDQCIKLDIDDYLYFFGE